MVKKWEKMKISTKNEKKWGAMKNIFKNEKMKIMTSGQPEPVAQSRIFTLQKKYVLFASMKGL